MRTLLASLIACTLLPAAGCDQKDDCDDVAPLAGADIAAGYRNPATGLCESAGGPGEYWSCDGPRPLPESDQAQPDWALCYGACDGLAESACLETAGCRAAYVEEAFYECWGTAPSGPIRGGDCALLGAQECSRHDDCVAHHVAGAPIGAFARCAAEPTDEAGCYSDDECEPDEHCNADEVCLPAPGCDAESGLDCPAVCYGYCVPDEEPGPGSCVGEVACDEPPPECPEMTLPGRSGLCWTGYCIPIDQCDALPACADLGEEACVDRADCLPYYEGLDCTCDDAGCTCADWQYRECSTA